MKDKELDVEVHVLTDGTVKFIYYDELAGLKDIGNVEVSRASHVLPVSFSLKFLFKFLRKVYGEKGAVANFTRKWRCKWGVDLSPVNGPQLGPFEDRDLAIAAEIEWLSKNYLNKQDLQGEA